jgi:polyhydroxyalkanoate synthesis regulator phasin
LNLIVFEAIELAETGGVVKRVLAKQLEPIKDDLEYIKKQVDAIRNRVDGLATQIAQIEEALKKVKVA